MEARSLSLNLTLKTRVFRDQTLNRQDAYKVTKFFTLVAAEFVFLFGIPLGIIETIFYTALSWALAPLVFFGALSSAEDSAYGKSTMAQKESLMASLQSIFMCVFNMNPNMSSLAITERVFQIESRIAREATASSVPVPVSAVAQQQTTPSSSVETTREPEERKENSNVTVRPSSLLSTRVLLDPPPQRSMLTEERSAFDFVYAITPPPVRAPEPARVRVPQQHDSEEVKFNGRGQVVRPSDRRTTPPPRID